MNLSYATTYAVDDQGCSQNDYINLTTNESAWGYYFYDSNPRQYEFYNNSLKFGRSYGSINFTNTSLYASGSNLSDVINVTSNNAFVNSVVEPGFNTTADITLESISVSELQMIVDNNDNGEYEACPDNICVNLSYNGSTAIFNVTHFTSYGIQESNTAPDNPIVTFSSSGAENISSESMLCGATISDFDGDSLDVDVQWFLNGSLNLTTSYSSQSNGSAFSAGLTSGNTTKYDNWSCGMRFYDGSFYSDWVNASSNITIVNDVPVVTLSSPSDWASSMNRSLAFSWNIDDADSDPITYEFNLSEEYFIGDGTCEDDRYDDTLTDTSYFPATDLTCLYDNGYYYNWSVRAYDGEVYGDWTSVWHVNITADTTISISNASMNFGTLAPLTIENTSDDSPNPFTINNDGNSIMNISLNSSSLWGVANFNSSYYRFKVDNKSGEAGSFDSNGSVTSWFDVPITGSVVAVKELNYKVDNDSAEVDIRLEVPTNEGPGPKNATIIFSSRLAE
jgi:hypothetical protein